MQFLDYYKEESNIKDKIAYKIIVTNEDNSIGLLNIKNLQTIKTLAAC